jgi:hypothetical protein
MTAIKQPHPDFGVKRIAQILRRGLWLPGSPETVRRTLPEPQLLPPPKHQRKPNPPKPRFFERATANQLWPSDIFLFQLYGQNAYLILDDYSRYLVGFGAVSQPDGGAGGGGGSPGDSGVRRAAGNARRRFRMLALRGVPQEPFYLVGRLGRQSVVIHAEKGRVKLPIDGEHKPVTQLSYPLNPSQGEPRREQRKQTQEGTKAVQCPPTSPRGAGGVDPTPATGGGLLAAEHNWRRGRSGRWPAW